MNRSFMVAVLIAAFFIIASSSCKEDAPDKNVEHAQPKVSDKSADKGKIELLSYKNRDEWKRDPAIPELIVDSQIAIPAEHFRERIVLNDIQKKVLDSILHKTACNDRSINACIYEPRNAIVYYNATGKVTGYIELCFHCNQWHLSGNQSGVDMCRDKMLVLMPFLASTGIKYFRGE